jgi:creatine kinase
MFSRLLSSRKGLVALGAGAVASASVATVACGGGGSADFTKSQFGGKALGDDKDTMNFKYFTYESQPEFTDKHRSLMSKVLKENPGLFDKLKDMKTSLGYSLSNAIQAGVETPHLGVGITAGDEESWTLFKDIMYPIIKGWHKYDPESGFHPMDLDFSKLSFSDEQVAKFDQYVVSTRIRAARNISGHRLPAGATDEDRLAVEGLLKKAFAGFEGELAGKYYSLGGMTPEQEDFLQSNGFLFQKPKTTNLLSWAGAARNWPQGRGIFHNNEKTALCWCNEEDHCRIISMALGGDVKSVFRRFAQISDNLKRSTEADGVGLMFSPRLGFLGTCPSNLGTGLRASVMIKLPELNKDVELLEKVCDAFDLQPRGSAGEHSAAVGAKWDISNKQRLGFSEVQLVQKMIDGVSKIIALEEKLAAGGSITDADLSGDVAASTGGADTAALEAKIAALETKVDGIQGAVFGIADILGVKRG